MLPCGTTKRHFSVHFAFRIPTKSTLGALLVPLFGQFLEEVFSEVASHLYILPLFTNYRVTKTTVFGTLHCRSSRKFASGFGRWHHA
jgi:hypothetical protein